MGRPVGGAYGVFLSENRAKIMQGLPAGYQVMDIGKAAGAQWKALSDAAKKPYEAKFKIKQEEYKAALEEYKKTHGDVDEDAGEEEEDEEEEDSPAPKKKVRKAGA